MESSNSIPFALSGFKIDQVAECGDLLVFRAHSIATTAICPYCGQSSSRAYGSNTRAPRDLP